MPDPAPPNDRNKLARTPTPAGASPAPTTAPASGGGETPVTSVAPKPIDTGAVPAAPHYGGYRVVREIGRGGMGVVLEAEDAGLGRRVAVKVMNASVAVHTVSRERFLREARAAATVRHDNVVTIHQVGEQDGVPFFVMPLLEGEPLSRRLGHGPLPPDEVVRLGREIASGLAAAHAAGLVHRDVKPANLWLEAPDGRVKILDFGLARLTSGGDQITESGAVLGTPDYMAPEQAEGGFVDHRADLFSLGAVLYHAATGGKPFRGATTLAVLKAVSEHTPPHARAVNPDVPGALADVLARLLAKKPDDRFQTAAEVLAALAACAAGAGPRHLPTTVSLAPAPVRPRRWRWAALVAGAILAVGGAILLRSCVFAEKGGGPGGGAVVSRGQVDATAWRDGRWVPLLNPAALPIKTGDHFKVSVQVDAPSYLYVFWIEPDGEASPLYPWSDVRWGTRLAAEKPVTHLSLPGTDDFTPDPKRPLVGVTTIVAFASPEPLRLSDAEFQKWFEGLPRIERAKNDTRAVVWFDNYAPPREDRSRAPKVIGSIDPYERWQLELRKRVGAAAPFQTSLSFAQGENK